MGLLDKLSGEEVANKINTTINAESKDVHQGSPNTHGSLAGLNLKQVMDAHTAWKGRLLQQLDGTSTEAIDIEIASQDCHCFLGKWLYSEGKNKFGELPEYESTRKAHAEFHFWAGEVLAQYALGNDEESRKLLNTKFRLASNRNQLQLALLFAAAKRS